jgi:hypothetical protein
MKAQSNEPPGSSQWCSYHHQLHGTQQHMCRGEQGMCRGTLYQQWIPEQHTPAPSTMQHAPRCDVVVHLLLLDQACVVWLS